MSSYTPQLGRQFALQIARKYNLDPNLFIPQLEQESGFRADAVSPVGARGPGQFMPATWQDPGFGLSFAGDINDPYANIEAAAQYNKVLLDRYNGDEAKALAAYNWGAGNADKWSGDPQQLPEETRNYLNTILGGGADDVMSLASRNGPVTIADEAGGYAQNPSFSPSIMEEREPQGTQFHAGNALQSLGAAIAATSQGQSAAPQLSQIRDQYFSEQEAEYAKQMQDQQRRALISMVGEGSEFGQALAQGADPQAVLQAYMQQQGFAQQQQLAAQEFGYDSALQNNKYGWDAAQYDAELGASASAMEAQREGYAAIAETTNGPEAANIIRSLPPQMFSDPETARKNMEPFIGKDAAEAVVMSQGQSLVDKSTGEIITAIQESPSETFRVLTPQEAAELGLDQNTQYQISTKTNRISPVTGGGQTINVGAQEGSYARERGAGYAKQADNIQSIARAATGDLANVQIMRQALQNGDFYTGIGGDWVQQGRRLAGAFGIADADALGSAELVETITNRLALGQRSTGDGAGMPGAMSDADRDFLVKTVPGLLKSPGGNERILDFLEKVSQREIEVARMAADYEQKNGALDVGFDQKLMSYVRDNPLFTAKSANDAPTAAAPRSNVAVPATKSEYDALPSGSIYIDQDGNAKRKK